MMIMIAIAAAAAQCQGMPIEREIAHYAELIRTQDSAAIAHLFGTDGVIDNPGSKPIRGEAEVKALLSGFKGAVVKSEEMTVAKVDADGAAWHVTGRFHQSGRSPEPKDYDVSGSFDSTWTCGADGWRVNRMATGK